MAAVACSWRAVLAVVTGLATTAEPASLLREAVDLSYNTAEGRFVTLPGRETSYKHKILHRGPFGSRNIYMENNMFTQAGMERGGGGGVRRRHGPLKSAVSC